MDKEKIVVLFLSFFFIAFSKDTSFQKTFVRSFTAPDSGSIEIKNPSGELSVKVWDKREIEIRYRIYADDGDLARSRNLVNWTKIEAEKSKDKIIVNAKLPLEIIKKLRAPYLDNRSEFESIWESL